MPTTQNEHGQLIDELKNQLLITLIKRAGGAVEIPVSEVDDTGQDLLNMRVDPDKRLFYFSISKKS